MAPRRKIPEKQVPQVSGIWTFWPCTSKTMFLFVGAYAAGLIIVLTLSQMREKLHSAESNAAMMLSSTHTYNDIDEQNALNGTQEIIPPGHKVILYWNMFFRAEDFRFGFGQEPFLRWKCPVNTCYTTTNKNLINQADAVMVHGPEVHPIPPKPKPGQKFIYVQGEPHQEQSERNLPELFGYFNMTMTHRLDSDIRLPYAYIERNAQTDQKISVQPEKRKPLVWVVSHCDTPSKREVYAKELAKYIDIDIYGECGTHKCPKKKNAKCRDMFEANYNFYLSFENDVCKDYASEKLYHPLRYNIVPVVYGGANYTHDTPPHSVINIQDFPNPSDLAKYLKHLITHPQEYKQYLAWKNKGYTLEMDRKTIMAKAMCELCQVLHDPQYVLKDYRDIKSWWMDGICDSRAMAKLQKQW